MALAANGSDLDCTAPEQVPLTLRYTAERYRESTADLQSAWQDPNAGLVWSKLADEMEKSAARCEKIIARYFK